MRQSDREVREVVCSETGKPMPKIPAWMADIEVKFVSDEAKQRHPTLAGIPETEIRRATLDTEEEKDLDIDAEAEEEGEEEFDEAEDASDEEY